MSERYTRAERLAQILERRGRGWTGQQIADDLGMTASGVKNILNDPDGSKQRERRKRYQGTCRVCGGPTDGANGRALAPTLCASCDLARREEERLWTRETVIDAIQRFARQHGRPPVAEEWITRDYENDYPCRTCVYGNSAPPFASWADAIEAAGFPRPAQGQWQLVERAQWTDEQVIAAIRAWATEHGGPPKQRDWHLANGNPSHGTVQYHFGSWNDGIRAAGFTPRRRGGQQSVREAAS